VAALTGPAARWLLVKSLQNPEGRKEEHNINFKPDFVTEEFSGFSYFWVGFVKVAGRSLAVVVTCSKVHYSVPEKQT
jgi:hypothetical protein